MDVSSESTISVPNLILLGFDILLEGFRHIFADAFHFGMCARQNSLFSSSS